MLSRKMEQIRLPTRPVCKSMQNWIARIRWQVVFIPRFSEDMTHAEMVNRTQLSDQKTLDDDAGVRGYEQVSEKFKEYNDDVVNLAPPSER